MKIFVLTFSLLVSSALADQVENVDIDWSNVRPIQYYPKFWDDKPAELRPPASVFEKYERERMSGGRIVGGYFAQ